jgi:CHRD domain
MTFPQRRAVITFVLTRAFLRSRQRPVPSPFNGGRAADVRIASLRETDFSMTGPGRCQMRFRLLIAVMGSLLVTASLATAEQIGALLTGYEESPSVSTTGTGEFTATIAPDGEGIYYSKTYSGLQETVTQSHIHVGQLGVNGSIVIFLCQTATNPDPTGLAPPCPQEGTVSGTITAANVIAGSMVGRIDIEFPPPYSM